MADQVDLSEDIYGKLINIAGRQRMLSQRIGFLLVSASSQKVEDLTDTTIWAMLERALDDFQNGHQLLLNGDETAGLPRLTSERIDAVLQDPAPDKGLNVIERFAADARQHLQTLKSGNPVDREAFGAFSNLVLVDLLQTLQAVVTALEEDFAEEMRRRKNRRVEEAQRVMDAIQEIQKASKFSRMIALNAKISADRAGPFGKEFGALTEELKQISNAITDSSENILKHLDRI